MDIHTFLQQVFATAQMFFGQNCFFAPSRSIPQRIGCKQELRAPGTLPFWAKIGRCRWGIFMRARLVRCCFKTLQLILIPSPEVLFGVSRGPLLDCVATPSPSLYHMSNNMESEFLKGRDQCAESDRIWTLWHSQWTSLRIYRFSALAISCCCGGSTSLESCATGAMKQRRHRASCNCAVEWQSSGILFSLYGKSIKIRIWAFCSSSSWLTSFVLAEWQIEE